MALCVVVLSAKASPVLILSGCSLATTGVTVCPMGSVAPASDDTFAGFVAVRSIEDAEAREARRLELQERRSRSVHGVDEEKSDEDWMVTWEEGEKANPKVSLTATAVHQAWPSARADRFLGLAELDGGV